MSIGPISDYDYWKLSNGPYEDEEPDEGFDDPRYDLYHEEDEE